MHSNTESPEFKDQNFKLAVINALVKIGHFGDVVEEIKSNEEYAGDGPYFAELEEDAWYGPHPEVLAKILEIPLTWKQLERIKQLTPDAGDELYTLISPNWDGEDDQFLATSLDDILLLKNLEEFSFFHIALTTDFAQLLNAPKLLKIKSPGLGYVDGTEDSVTQLKLQEKGVQFEFSEPEGDDLYLDVLKFEKDKPKVLLFHLDEVPEYAGIDFDTFGMIDSIRQSPFYLFDQTFEKIEIEFPDEKPSTKVENKAGFNAIGTVATEFIASTFGVSYLFNCNGDSFNYIPGFVHNVDMEQVTEAFEDAGFEVFTMEDYLEL